MYWNEIQSGAAAHQSSMQYIKAEKLYINNTSVQSSARIH